MESTPQPATMNELQFIKTYSYLKKSYMLLYKELSMIKEKNEHLNKRVKELETTISSIGQHTMTKEEMKQIIKEGIGPVINMIQKRIKKVEHEDTLNFSSIHNNVLSLIETNDKRIASGSEGGKISIFSHIVDKDTWKIDIYERYAHRIGVTSLCPINYKL